MSSKISDPEDVVGKTIRLVEDDEAFLPRKKGDLFHVTRYNGGGSFLASPYVVGYWDGDPVPATEGDEWFVAHRHFEKCDEQRRVGCR